MSGGVYSQAHKVTSIYDRIDEYVNFLQNFQQVNHIPSISFAIIKNQELVFSTAFGYADIKNKIVATDNTVYSIASLTKPIAATLIMKLQERGKINIDKKIRDYWPGYNEYFTTMKIEALRSNAELVPFIKNYRYKEYGITVRHHLTHTAEGKPGTAFRYNGFLFGKLATVVDNVIPQKFIGLMDSLFKKLNMQHSSLQYKSLKKESILALPYVHPIDSVLIPVPFPSPHTLNAGAGLISSVKDLAKFDIAFDKNLLVTAKTKKQMFTPAKGANGKLFQYGLGWFITGYNKQPVMYHYGLQNSYSGFYLKLLQQNITLIILSNSGDLTRNYSNEIMNANLKAVPYAARFLELFSDENNK